MHWIRLLDITKSHNRVRACIKELQDQFSKAIWGNNLIWSGFFYYCKTWDGKKIAFLNVKFSLLSISYLLPKRWQLAAGAQMAKKIPFHMAICFLHITNHIFCQFNFCCNRGNHFWLEKSHLIFDICTNRKFLPLPIKSFSICVPLILMKYVATGYSQKRHAWKSGVLFYRLSVAFYWYGDPLIHTPTPWLTHICFTRISLTRHFRRFPFLT